MDRHEETVSQVQRCNEEARRGARRGVRRIAVGAFSTFIRTAVAGLVIVFAAFGVSGTAWADLRIVTETSVAIPGMPQIPGLGGMGDMFGGDGTEELFIKNHRILMPSADGIDFLIACATGEFAMINSAHAAYWQGTVEEMRTELAALFKMMNADDADVDGFASMFGSAEGGQVPIRTTYVGTETVAGYDAERYRVEFEQDGVWELFEEAWIAPALMRELAAEVGDCLTATFQDVQTTLSALFVGDADGMWSVVESPEYLALFEQGYPVRQRSAVTTFGMTIETDVRVTTVSREPLNEALFDIPDHYRRITLLEAIMGGGI